MHSPEREEQRVSGLTDLEVARLASAALAAPADDLPPVPAPSTAQILQMMRQRRRRQLRAKILSSGRYAAVVVAVMALSAAGWLTGIGREPDQIPADAPTGDARMLTLAPPGQWQPARKQLTALAGAVARLPHTSPAGPFTYTRTRLWARAATTAGAPPVIHDEQRWWAPDRSGRQTRTTIFGWSPGYDPGPGLPTADPGHDVSYRPGEMTVIAAELSDNVFQVSSQLADQQDPADGPQATLRAVREVYRFHDPNPGQRAALLQALADTDGLIIAGTADGGAGRRGIAVIADSDQGATRDIAVFDPATGRMLAYDTVWIRAPKAVDIPTPALADSLLFLAATHTTDPR
jgi:hypothetical protein